MKNLIITIGIVVFIVTITGMQFTCNQMLHTKQEMKFAADEAAATAALCLDEEAFGDGNLYFNKEKAGAQAKAMAGLNMPKGKCKVDIEFFAGERPAVKVIIKRGRLTAVSKYEYVAY
ncbi:hypothetical protein [Aminicella lysinilytica]|uniref:Flp pilus-assembly TadE/G-like protein n=1 Tax=Aminicella lysinilytica TaxID=433323 RepID=A0A4R6QDX6_9FIRM|nr:hypothetical protein [Aminicella lysinilytica]NLD10906.1 hypothetical protein [Clostridiales bacterium]TDP59639.1 hypothetical protein EV211_10360 [Aminicella lysinilytica]